MDIRKSLQFHSVTNLKRCTKCILPETMPFIEFDDEGICNYCHNYTPCNRPKPKDLFLNALEPYRRASGPECIVPFSGGRDSCFGLHLIVKELGLTPITYTYDWGMVTDVGHKNIELMTKSLGVENITIKADHHLKQSNIAKNLRAWLENPNLGMLNILTAGDKHFFKHIEDVKKSTNVQLNLWGINPLEVTHFKTGFLGVAPDFISNEVYKSGLKKQVFYQSKRLKAMLRSPRYFNTSIADTLSGEYYRSFAKKKDYFHIFDFYRWDEKEIDSTLDSYGWHRAKDTSTTWRIGDGVSGFLNYVYYTVAGFTEHDTFRSNQIREGDITREQALVFIAEENKPRYENIQWFLETINFNPIDVINRINSLPKLYRNEE